MGFIYIISFFFIIRNFLKVLKNDLNYDLKLVHKIPLLFILSSCLVGNIANINISLPYYSINLIMILLGYKYILSKSILNERPDSITQNKIYST